MVLFNLVQLAGSLSQGDPTIHPFERQRYAKSFLNGRLPRSLAYELAEKRGSGIGEGGELPRDDLLRAVHAIINQRRGGYIMTGTGGDLYPRSEHLLTSSNSMRASGASAKRLLDSYEDAKNCTCNPAKRFQRMGNAQVLKKCNCSSC